MVLLSQKEGTRSYGIDNLKFILIFSVVLGHFLEISPAFRNFELLYLVIYSFHMPAFIFLAGYFARYSRKRIILQFAYTYILFQVLYRVFDYYILKENPGSGLVLKYTYPYWILWYLLVLLLFYLLIPLIDIKGTKERSILLLGFFVLSLLAGYDNNVGYYISLSRFFSFLPFFVMGFYWKKTEKETGKAVTFLPVNSYLIKALITVAVIASVFYLKADERIRKDALFGSRSYYIGGYNIWLKLSITAIAVVWIAFFFMVILPVVNRKIFLLSAIGRNSFSIFLLHGFALMLMEKYNIISIGKLWQPLLVLIGTLGILGLFGNTLTAKIFNFVFTGNWIDWLWNKISSKEKKTIE